VSEYKRLPGSRRGFVRHASAWAGADHILLVEGSRTAEKYRRIYFRDVQALTVERRNRFIFEPAWLWVAVALLIGSAIYPETQRDLRLTVSLLLVAAVPIYLIIAGMFYSCRLYIATAVGNVKVGSVFRTRQARKFHQAVTPLVLASQAELQETAS
jgi:hypothetical protein